VNGPRGTLHFISGRLASGKTTLAREISTTQLAVLFCEDVWLSKLSDGIRSFEDYLKWSRRCRSVMEPLIIETLKAGASVVMDFAGNTAAERSWVRSLFETARKQRHTSRRIYERILAEVPACTPAERTVRQYVERRKRILGLAELETFVPQSYDWGVEARVDWYEAYAE
jgi:predicted kinase